jgi:hypothetical protein
MFAIYALCNYAIIGKQLDDIFTIRTLTIVNPIFVFFAISCKNNKKDVIIAIFLLSLIYLAFIFQSIIQGDVQLGRITSPIIFSDFDEAKSTYQNITMYLGLLVISTLYFLSRQRIYYKIPGFLFVILTIIGMLLIGGRASIVALSIVLLIYLWKSNISGKHQRISSNSLLIILCAVISTIAIIRFWNDVLGFFQQTSGILRFSTLLEGGDSSERIFLFTSALNLFFRDIQTLFIGAGINSFPVYIGDYSKGMYPHNIPLELLCEYGMIGFILFMTPIAYVLYIRKKVIGSFYGDCIEENIVFLLCLYFWVSAMVTGDIGSSWVLLFFSFILLPSRIAESKSDIKRTVIGPLNALNIHG